MSLDTYDQDARCKRISLVFKHCGHCRTGFPLIFKDIKYAIYLPQVVKFYIRNCVCFSMFELYNSTAIVCNNETCSIFVPRHHEVATFNLSYDTPQRFTCYGGILANNTGDEVDRNHTLNAVGQNHSLTLTKLWMIVLLMVVPVLSLDLVNDAVDLDN